MISVFTPVHVTDLKFLKEAYASLLEQTMTNWEWVILANGLGTSADFADFTDPRVRVEKLYSAPYIGALKREACSRCKGDILVELDHDDILMPDCLEEVYKAFLSPEIHMAYSGGAEFHNETWAPRIYSPDYGWKGRPGMYKDKMFIEMVAWPPSPHSFRRVEWAPNHVRAWRKTSYEEIGGHNSSMKVGDDHDICCRFYVKYGAKGIKLIDKCLYLQRITGDNTSNVQNNAVQTQVAENYNKYIRPMAERWAKDEQLQIVDLGGRFDAPAGYTTVDLQDADIIADLDEQWPFEDSSVGIIRASHIFEHLSNKIDVMNECFRVLAPGGFLFLEVPSTDGRGAFQDPTHLSYWNQNSIWYWTRESHRKYIRPSFMGAFQELRLEDKSWGDNIIVTQADLVCLKPPYSDWVPGGIR